MTSFHLSIESNAREVGDLLAEIGERIIDQAHVAAVNKTMTQARTAIRKDVAQATGVPSRALSKRLKLHRAKRNRAQAILFVGTFPVPAIALGASQARRGVTHRGGTGRVKLPNAFISVMRSGHRGVYQRRGKRRLPIDEVRVPIHEAARSAAIKQTQSVMPNNFARLYNQEFQYRTQRAITKRRLGR